MCICIYMYWRDFVSHPQLDFIGYAFISAIQFHSDILLYVYSNLIILETR